MGSDDGPRNGSPGGTEVSADRTDASAEDGSDDRDLVTVTVYSREHCHLCDEAVATLERAAAAVDVPVAVTEIDVDNDPELREAYGDRVPYVLIEGRPAFKYRVDPDEARRRLREAGE